MVEVVCEGYVIYLRILQKKRVRRSKALWIEESYQGAYKIIKEDQMSGMGTDNND